jgi:hypothetical protein
MRRILCPLIFLLLLFAVGEGRRHRGRSLRNKVGRTGAVLGGGVVTMLKELREKPQALPKGYKREVERPVVEDYTLLYKMKQGLKNLQYLAYATGVGLLLYVAAKIYTAVRISYLRYRISQLPPEQQEELLNEVMALDPIPSPKKEVECVDREKSRELRLKNDYKRKLKR